VKLIFVAGARPNFMKIAPLIWEARKRPNLEVYLVHTGQHYDEKMSKLFFEQLQLPRPDIDLEVGSGSHAAQTAEVMKRFEPVLLKEHPDGVVVVGDVNSTLACTLTSTKLGIPVAHVEAGLRSFDRTMPEEINRILTDSISHWLFVTEPSGVKHLQNEGISPERVFLVGNVMIDTLIACQKTFEQSPILEEFGLTEKGYGVVTLHRPANVDDPETFAGLLRMLNAVQQELPLIFPVHPRTRKVMAAQTVSMKNLRLTEPLGYLEFMKLVSKARIVLTDSGGIQEETTYLGVPCLTLRNNTERPVTIEVGTNRLVGLDPDRVIREALEVLRSPFKIGRIPDLWDGKASARILDVLTSLR
jgi:UDP-N-acetylglucosamine 2-epimerase (non-hydrolysing)